MRERKIVSKDHYVFINIWTSEKNKAIRGDNVGHISIECVTDNVSTYMSLWPAARDPNTRVSGHNLSKNGQIKRAVGQFFEVRPKHLMQCYQDDVLTEGGRDAEVRLVLYGLDIGTLRQQFDHLKETTKGWRLIGSNLLQQITTKGTAESCASFAYRILKSGGLHRGQGVKKSTASSRVSSIVSPDEMVKQVLAAKEIERKNNPETQHWHQEGETPPDMVREALSQAGEKTSVECRIS